MIIKANVTYDARTDRLEGADIGRDRLVFMVRGLLSSWKQPVAYYLMYSTVDQKILTSLIKHVITSLLSIGLCLKVLVCDQGPSNRSCLTKHLATSIEKPYFELNVQSFFLLSVCSMHLTSSKM